MGSIAKILHIPFGAFDYKHQFCFEEIGGIRILSAQITGLAAKARFWANHSQHFSALSSALVDSAIPAGVAEGRVCPCWWDASPLVVQIKSVWSQIGDFQQHLHACYDPHNIDLPCFVALPADSSSCTVPDKSPVPPKFQRSMYRFIQGQNFSTNLLEYCCTKLSKTLHRSAYDRYERIERGSQDSSTSSSSSSSDSTDSFTLNSSHSIFKVIDELSLADLGKWFQCGGRVSKHVQMVLLKTA
eukprot:1721535-Karenia_brevis.AAC.1